MKYDSNISIYSGTSDLWITPDATNTVYTSTYNATDLHLAELQKQIKEMREMLLMLNRDNILEEKYPKLKECADEYHRLLEKYKTFEILKGTSE